MGSCIAHYQFRKYTIDNTYPFTFKNEWCRVVQIIDGDTIKVAIKIYGHVHLETIRLYGINAPETRTVNLEEKQKGLETKEYLVKRLKNKIVRCQFNKRYKDKYGRLLGVIWLKKENINRILIENGLAVEYIVNSSN